MLPLLLTMISGYAVISANCINSGAILSIQVSAFYLLLLTGFWADRRVGKVMIMINLLVIFFLYLYSQQGKIKGIDEVEVAYSPESLEIALIYHLSITLFFGVFFWMVYHQYDEAKRKIRMQQRQQISTLNLAVKQRSQQLLTMRQNLARDFHDETGNMLSAITRQASVLRLKLANGNETKSLIDNIIVNSERLYASSRDFLWSINHNSDDPMELFEHLTDFGQQFYNQFDIAFSVQSLIKNENREVQIAPFIARHVIYIFKEAMTNTAKHAGADEVILEMLIFEKHMSLSLTDNGKWKEADPLVSHSGISNIKKRSVENGMKFNIYPSDKGTQIQLEVQLHEQEFKN
jgi:signal transduction histidine kinase